MKSVAAAGTLVAWVVVAACSSSSSGTNGASSSTSSTSSSGGTDAGPGTGGPCTDQDKSTTTPYEDTPVLSSGTSLLRGTVTTASPIPGGTRLVLALATNATSGMDVANDEQSFTIGSSSSSFDFAFRNIASGTYWVFVAIDANGDGKLGEGDIGGYYDGTTAAPIQDGLKAKPIVVTGAGACGLSWGIGPYKCLGHYGDACTSDADCRGTWCASGPVSSKVTQPGACSAGKCVQQTCTSGTPTEGGCFGGHPG